jgi:acyl-CoA thioesterase-1
MAALLLFVSTIYSINVSHTPVIVAVGDSLTAGADHYDSSYPIQLGGMLGARIINKGVSGETTTQILARFDSIESCHPDYILIMGGHNDLGRDGAARTIANLQEMYHRALQNHSKVVALTITPYNECPKDLQIVNSWILGQRDPSIIPVDVFTPLTLSGTNLLDPKYDGGGFVHLNKEGYRVIASELFMVVFHGKPFAPTSPKDHLGSNGLLAMGLIAASCAVAPS